LDPLADKLLLVAGIVLLSLNNKPHLHSIPVWLTVTILSRDILLLIGLVVIHLVVGKVAVRPHVIGKVATVLQMAVVLWVLLKWAESWIIPLSIAAAVCTGTSGLLYVYEGMRQLSTSPSSSPSPRQDQL
jgi:cardiolipin synthase